jgi:hypothetical protein
VSDQDDVSKLEGVDEGFHVAEMRLERVVDVRFVRFAEADIVDGNYPAMRRHVAHDVAPEIGRGRIAVEKEKHVILPLVDIVHLRAQDFDIFRLIGECGRQHPRARVWPEGSRHRVHVDATSSRQQGCANLSLVIGLSLLTLLRSSRVVRRQGVTDALPTSARHVRRDSATTPPWRLCPKHSYGAPLNRHRLHSPPPTA